ncbi:MAG: FAD-dependent oxidoreductase [Holophaga sp.]|nr:FAD-dependent oxidoreductase [Holophaga sp.]
MEFRERYDFVVIGGGLVGASIAWGLSRAGARPLVLDEGDLALRASRANFALVFMQGKGLGFPAYAIACRTAADRWPQFATELKAESGIDVALRQQGGFSFCMSQAEMENQRVARETIARETGDRAAKYQVLSRQETRDRLPGIGPSVAGSIFCAKDGHVNALRVFFALHKAMAARGCDYRAEHRVGTIEPTADGFRIQGDWGEVRAGKVILAAGVANERLAPMVGLSSPLKRDKGQVLVTEKCAPFFPYGSATICQGDEGGIKLGSSTEALSESILTNQSLTAVIARRAIQVFPSLATLNVVRTWTGFRVMPPDGFPIYGQSASAPGAFVASCHSGLGLAPNHAFELAPQILAGRLEAGFSPFTAGRFCVSQAH